MALSGVPLSSSGVKAVADAHQYRAEWRAELLGAWLLWREFFGDAGSGNIFDHVGNSHLRPRPAAGLNQVNQCV